MKPVFYHVIFLSFFLSLNVFGGANSAIVFSVSKAGELPVSGDGEDHPGVAGAFSGISSGKLIVAGGANFPDRMPWEGGIKAFHDQIYVYQAGADSLLLTDSSQKLPFPVAYGASVSLPEGVLCIGGNDRETAYSDVFLLSWDDQQNQIRTETYPDLPLPLTYASAVLSGNTVYLVAGSSSPDGTDTGNHFFRLDLSRKGSAGFEWEALPAFPGNGRIHAVSVMQSNGIRPCLYLFSGRNVNPENRVTVFNDGLLYDPVLRQWEKTGVSGLPGFPVMAGTASALGSSGILFFGGAPGELLSREVELRTNLSSAIRSRDTLAVAMAKDALIQYYKGHPGFSNDILLYNTITRALTRMATSPVVLPVTSKAVRWGERIILTSGEIRPGVRTPGLLTLQVKQQQFRFGWLNSSVIVLYFLVLLVIGYLFSGKQKNTDDYFKGGGRIPWWAAGISLFGTALSAITFMAIPAKTYATDWSYFLLNMSIFLVAPLIIILFIPFFRNLNITTAYEYLEQRFNLTIRLLGSVSFILFQIGRMGIILLLPSLALNVVTGMDVFACILLMGIISLLYTLMGGIEAVIWTDVIQVVVLLAGAVIAVVLIVMHVDGGVPAIYDMAAENGKFNLLDLRMTLREPTVWVMLIGGMFTNITTYGTDQTMVQRYLTTKSEKEARRSVWTNAWMAVPATVLFFAIGTALFAFYRTFPEQMNPALENLDSIFPWYIASQMPDGLSGLLIAGIFAAAMSSLSSSMNSAATAYSTDLHFRFGLTSRVSPLKVARFSTLGIGLAGTLFALFMATWNIQSLWDEFNKMIGLIIGSLGGLFLLGILTRRANGAGALIGLVFSIAVQILVARYQVVHLLMYSATGVISCFVFGWLGSMLFPKYHKQIDGLTIHTLVKKE
ncbi:MAG: sodium/solute symporter [Prolixibacteraceae bacterium]